MALTSTRIAVEFYRIQSVGGASLSSVIARPTTNRITSVAEHGFVDLPDKVEAVPQVSTGYGVLLLDATNQAGISESFGWQIGLVGEYGSLTLAVPSAPGGGRTVTVGGTSYPAVWLTDLADFSAVDGSLPLSSFFTKSEVDARFAALPFRSDNTTLTGAAVGKLSAVADVSPLSFSLMEYFKVLAGDPGNLIAGTITRDANGAATSAPVVWPDGRPGVYTATTVSTAFPGAVDAYTITYDAAGADPDLTYTQPAVTRDANGAVTARPAITVA